MKYEKKHQISVKEATHIGIIRKEWNRGYQQYFWYADGGSPNGHDTAFGALEEYYTEVIPERIKKENIEKEENIKSGHGFPVYMDKTKDTAEFLNPRDEKIETVSIRKFRQIVFDLEDEFGMKAVYVDYPLQ